ncbi:MAG: ROK family protein [Vallitalea sp.]|jgi:predicted NBD/HSP70 family sugar kinase|nr:ROK family protein [Vallitalea sp.]
MIKRLASNDYIIGKKEKMVYNLIRRYKKISRKELLFHTKFKIATLYRIIENLLKQKLIKVSGIAESSKGGRPSELFSINEALNFIVCIVVYREHFTISITDLNGYILKSRYQKITYDMTTETFIDLVYSDYQNMIECLQIDNDEVLGIGMACVGPIDIEKGIVLNTYRFQGKGWINAPLVQMLRNKFDKRVVMENIARGCINGQYWLHYVHKYNTMAYVTIGKGIGAGLISNGLVVRRKTGVVKKGIGHMIVDIDGKKCICGNYGCIETYSTIFAIKDQILSEIKRGRQSSINMDNITIDDINEAYEEGDDVVCRVVYDAANYFATGMVNYINIVDVEILLIGGKLIETCPSFRDLVYKFIHERTTDDINVVFIDNEENSVISGMAMFLLDTYLS